MKKRKDVDVSRLRHVAKRSTMRIEDCGCKERSVGLHWGEEACKRKKKWRACYHVHGSKHDGYHVTHVVSNSNNFKKKSKHDGCHDDEIWDIGNSLVARYWPNRGSARVIVVMAFGWTTCVFLFELFVLDELYLLFVAELFHMMHLNHVGFFFFFSQCVFWSWISIF